MSEPTTAPSIDPFFDPGQHFPIPRPDHSRIVSSTPEHHPAVDCSIPPKHLTPAGWCPGCPYLKIKTGPIPANCAACDVPESVRNPAAEREYRKTIWYAARLVVVLHGCSAQGCQLSRGIRGGGMVGTANICRCLEEARNLINAISERVKE